MSGRGWQRQSSCWLWSHPWQGVAEGAQTVEKTTPVNVQTQTTGDQLIDLQKAYQSGAINEQQYNKMKQDIIDKSAK